MRHLRVVLTFILLRRRSRRIVVRGCLGRAVSAGSWDIRSLRTIWALQRIGCLRSIWCLRNIWCLGGVRGLGGTKRWVTRVAVHWGLRLMCVLIGSVARSGAWRIVICGWGLQLPSPFVVTWLIVKSRRIRGVIWQSARWSRELLSRGLILVLSWESGIWMWWGSRW